MAKSESRKERTIIDPEERDQLAIEVARQKYEKGRMNAEIAAEMELSQATVTRLLTECRERDLIRVRAADSAWDGVDQALGAELQEIFHLDHVAVVNCKNAAPPVSLGPADADDYLHRSLAMAAAPMLRIAFRSGDHIGVGSGRGVFLSVQALYEQRYLPQRNLTLSSLSGTQNTLGWGDALWNSFYSADADYIVKSLGRCFEKGQAVSWAQNCQLAYSDQAMRDTVLQMLKQRPDRDNQGWPNALPDIALIGIGSLIPHHAFFRYRESTDLRAISHLLEKVMRLSIELPPPFPVCDICNKLYFMEHAAQRLSADAVRAIKELIHEINSRTVAVTRDDLLQVRKIIAIAGGEAKIEAIWGVLNASQAQEDDGPPPIHELYTDTETAHRLRERYLGAHSR
jgi:DNA-binding transcriptional regulator LsrR (DeoR family)